MSDNVIDLSYLPAPEVVEVLSFEAILEAYTNDFKERYPDFAAYIENEPVMKLMEVVAYRELIMRQRINDAAHAVMPAYAQGSDLDNIALIFGVKRLTLEEADPDAVPPTAAVMESDEDLRKRYFLAINALNTAGARNSYIYHAFSCPEVKDVAATSPVPGQVLVTVLGRTDDGIPADETITEVAGILNADDIRPLTDTVTVQKAKIVNYRVEAQIVTLPGPDPELIVAAAREAIESYVAGVSLIGRDVTMSGLYSALHQSGVERVIMNEPLQTISIAEDEASFCTEIVLTHTLMGV